MPTETPSERETREDLEAAEALLAQETAQTSSPHVITQQIRAAQETMLTARAANEHAQMVAWNNPDLVLNRATVLLACICLVRLHRPHWRAQIIAEHLRPSFPEFEIRPRDIHTLYLATCWNRPHWVREMRRVEDERESANADLMLRVLPTGLLARLPQLPLERYRDPRDGIRYLQDLVDVRDGDR